MFKLKKVKAGIGLALVVIACLSLVLTGCSNSATTTPAATAAPTTTLPPTATPATTTTPPPPTAQEIAASALSAMSKVGTLQFSLNMQGHITGNSNNQPQDITLTVTGNGASDVAAKKVEVNLNTDITSANQSKISSPVLYYLIDGWQYIKVNVPLSGEQWIKIKVGTGPASGDQASAALAMLKSAISLSVKGTETVDGTACWVLDVTPDLKAISDLLNSFKQTAGAQSPIMADIDLSKFVKSLSIQEWVAQDTYLLKKSATSASIAASGTDLGSTAHAGDNFALDFTETLSITGYNQPVTITLPPEAANARDMTPQQ